MCVHDNSGEKDSEWIEVNDVETITNPQEISKENIEESITIPMSSLTRAHKSNFMLDNFLMNE